MDISPSHSDGSLVSMDESKSNSDRVRTLEVENIDDHELAVVDSIEKNACSTIYISEHVKAAGLDLFSRIVLVLAFHVKYNIYLYNLSTFDSCSSYMQERFTCGL